MQKSVTTRRRCTVARIADLNKWFWSLKKLVAALGIVVMVFEVRRISSTLAASTKQQPRLNLNSIPESVVFC
jgi:hypothetical protein